MERSFETQRITLFRSSQDVARTTISSYFPPMPIHGSGLHFLELSAISAVSRMRSLEQDLS